MWPCRGPTGRLLCSSFLVMTCFLIRDEHILPKKELRRSLQVVKPEGTLDCTEVHRESAGREWQEAPS